MKPKRSKLSPDLDHWRKTAGKGERRTVTVRVLSTISADELGKLLDDSGAERESVGRGVAAATVTAAALDSLAGKPGILSIEQPRLRFPRLKELA